MTDLLTRLKEATGPRAPEIMVLVGKLVDAEVMRALAYTNGGAPSTSTEKELDGFVNEARSALFLALQETDK